MTALYSDGVPLCTLPAPSAFHLSTTTEANCPVDTDLPEPHGDPPWPVYVEQAAILVADGRCALALDAPGFANLNGLRTEIAVTVENVDGLLTVERE